MSASLPVPSEDPTRSLDLRKRFKRDAEERLRGIRGDVREYLGGTNVDAADTRVLRSFRSFVDARLTEDYVEPVPPERAEVGRHWTGTHVRRAYDIGLKLAREDLARFGVDESTARHATSTRRAEHEYRRGREYLTAFYAAEDVAARLRKHATLTVEEDLANAETASTFADDVTNEMRTRANESVTAMANVVVVETINEALLTTYELADVDEIGVVPETEPSDDGTRQNAAGELEFQTAGDLRVCPSCMAAAGATVRISDARATPSIRPPLHPNCRCRLVPTDMSTGGTRAPARAGDAAEVTEGGEPISSEEES